MVYSNVLEMPRESKFKRCKREFCRRCLWKSEMIFDFLAKMFVSEVMFRIKGGCLNMSILLNILDNATTTCFITNVFHGAFKQKAPPPEKNRVHRKTVICTNIHNIAFIPARQCKLRKQHDKRRNKCFWNNMKTLWSAYVQTKNKTLNQKNY